MHTFACTSKTVKIVFWSLISLSSLQRWAPMSTDTLKRGLVDEESSAVDDSAAKRPRAASASSVTCVAIDGETGANTAQHLGSVRVWIMDTHPALCELSSESFCYARCSSIKALLTKCATIRAVRDRDDGRGIVIHVNGVPAAAFDHEWEVPFTKAIDAGLIVLDKGVAASWAEIDFDVLAGPSNESATVPRDVQACEGFERGVLARSRTCDGNDCPCC